jgi:hypothetical protein
MLLEKCKYSSVQMKVSFHCPSSVIAHLQIEFPQKRILIDLASIMLAKGWTEELKSCNMLGGINVEISGR